MAEILPRCAIGAVSAEFLKVFNRLKAIPGNDFRCRWSLPLENQRHPEFLVIYQEKFVFLISLCDLDEPAARELLEPSFAHFFPTRKVTPESFAEPAEATLQAFSEKLALPYGIGPRNLILFPNLSQKSLDRVQRLKPSASIYLGKEALAPGLLPSRLKALATRPMEPDAIQLVRKHFSPEVVLPSTIVPARPLSRNLQASLTECLLDYDQELAVKIDLALSREARSALSSPTLRLLTGVAGSGKSLVLLYRAILNARLDPAKRQIIFTHNKPLIVDLRRRLQLLGAPKSIECIHFQSWCGKLLDLPLRIFGDREKEQYLHKAMSSAKELENFPIEFLKDEIQWLKDYDVGDLPLYLRARRIGRGRGLTAEQRKKVFALFQEYQRLLATDHSEDWSGLALTLLHRAREHDLPLPRYDCVFIDEAQFFAPVWLKLICLSLNPAGSQLVLAADPTQGFLKRRESWSASGLNFRSRTIRLQHAYRNTREIIDYAARFYRVRQPNDEEEINLPAPEILARLAAGRKPEYIHVPAPQDEITRACNEIASLIRNGASPGHILVILSDGRRVQNMIAALNKALGRTIAVDPRDSGHASLVRVCSINAATGLEAPIVFLLGPARLLSEESSLRLHPEDRPDLLRDNTRKLYMAFTRAAQRLVLISSGSPQPCFQ